MIAHFCYCLKNNFAGKTLHGTFMCLENKDTSFSDPNGQFGLDKDFVRKGSSVFLIDLLSCCIMQNIKEMINKAN